MSNPDTLPTSNDPSGPCPHCGRISNFQIFRKVDLERATTGNVFHQDPNGSPQLVVITCFGCYEKTVVVERVDELDQVTPVMWWPTPGLAGIDRSVIPEAVASAYDEGVRCLAVQAPNAAVTMLRNALAQIVQDKGSEAAKGKNTLNAAIGQMVTDRTLWETFGTWAHNVRQMGNAGAHQESYADVTLGQAEDVRSLVGAIIDLLYVQHARVSAAAAPKKRAEVP